MPYSRATMEPCAKMLPISVTSPAACENKGVHAGGEHAQQEPPTLDAVQVRREPDRLLQLRGRFEQALDGFRDRGDPRQRRQVLQCDKMRDSKT